MTLDHSLSLELLGRFVVLAPALLLAALGAPTIAGRPLAERAIAWLVQLTMVAGLLASCGVLALMLLHNERHVVVDLGNWAAVPDYPEHGEAAAPRAHFHFALKFVFDRLSVPFAILTFALCGAIGAFANKYMHRERGFNRFFLLYALFVTGMIVTSLADTIETLFAGWELVGLSSALLVAFFIERPAPGRNGLQVWCVYRISDAALLLASVVMHNLTGEGDFDKLLGAGPWPLGQSLATPDQALLVGLLLLVAAAGKSALVPFSGWLPRAMEGPTPSSAVFYGALSVHLGAFLLLRASPLLDQSPILCAAVAALGLTTAVYGAFVGRAQTDIKTALSFASLTQVGVIVAEIGLGLRYLALVHILGHACLRTLQFLRAPSLLNDYRRLENALGARLPGPGGPFDRWLSGAGGAWAYRLAMDRGGLDAFLNDVFAAPFLRLLRLCDAAERRFTDSLAGRKSRESERPGTLAAPLDELR